MTRIKPGPGRIAVELLPESELTESGLWLPPSSRSDGHIGKVAAVADPYTIDGIPHEPDYVVGDTVAFGKYTGTEVGVGTAHSRVTYIILKEQEILCTIVEDPDEATA